MFSVSSNVSKYNQNYLNDIENKYKVKDFEKNAAAKYGFNTDGQYVGKNGSDGSASSNNNSTGLFNSSTGTIGSLTDQAKELARFNLGLNKDQGLFDFDLRNREFDANTGRQMKVNEQQNTWQSQLNRDTQDAQTNRLNLQIAGQDRQQEKGFGQQNFMTANAVRLASRRLGQ